MTFGDGTNIFVASMWRSGSTHIALGLGQMLGYRQASTAGYHGEGVEQQDINPYSGAILFPYGYQVFQQHVWGTSRNIQMLEGFKMKPIIVWRRIADTILSIYERMKKPGTFVIPGLPMPSRWEEMSGMNQQIWLAEVATPWQLQFYSTWKNAGIDRIFVNYDTFYTDQEKGFSRLLDWLRIAPAQEIPNFSQAIQNPHNLEKGIMDRGHSELHSRAIDAITRHVYAWDDPDMAAELL